MNAEDLVKDGDVKLLLYMLTILFHGVIHLKIFDSMFSPSFQFVLASCKRSSSFIVIFADSFEINEFWDPCVYLSFLFDYCK